MLLSRLEEATAIWANIEPKNKKRDLTSKLEREPSSKRSHKAIHGFIIWKWTTRFNLNFHEWRSSNQGCQVQGRFRLVVPKWDVVFLGQFVECNGKNWNWMTFLIWMTKTDWAQPRANDPHSFIIIWKKNSSIFWLGEGDMRKKVSS